LLPVVCGSGDLKSEAGGDTVTLAYAKEDVEVNKKEISAADAKADELMAPAIDEQRSFVKRLMNVACTTKGRAPYQGVDHCMYRLHVLLRE
jgi:hypothetical protein